MTPLFFLRLSSISLHCSPIQFTLAFFHAPLDVVVHFLVFLRSFRLKSFLSQFSPFVAQIKNFCSDPGFFLLTMCAKDLTGCFSHSKRAYQLVKDLTTVKQGKETTVQDRSGKCLTEAVSYTHLTLPTKVRV